MELNFICPYHEHLVLRDKSHATKLWQGLSERGKIEAKNDRWARGASYFGSATEIALLRSSIEQESRQVAWLNMALFAGRWLIEAFCQLEDTLSAKRYLSMTERNLSNLMQRRPYQKDALINNKEIRTAVARFIEDCRSNIQQHQSNNFEAYNCHLKVVNENDCYSGVH